MLNEERPCTLHPYPGLCRVPQTLNPHLLFYFYSIPPSIPDPYPTPCTGIVASMGSRRQRWRRKENMKPSLTTSWCASVCLMCVHVNVCAYVCFIFQCSAVLFVYRIQPSDAQARRHVAAGCQLQDSAPRPPRRACSGMHVLVALVGKADGGGFGWEGRLIRGSQVPSWVMCCNAKRRYTLQGVTDITTTDLTLSPQNYPRWQSNMRSETPNPAS